MPLVDLTMPIFMYTEKVGVMKDRTGDKGDVSKVELYSLPRSFFDLNRPTGM